MKVNLICIMTPAIIPDNGSRLIAATSACGCAEDIRAVIDGDDEIS